MSDVDLTLVAGEVHCLAGENGSGKSTLIKIISGVQPPDPGGRIVIDGREYPHLTPADSTRLGVQVIYQDLSLFPDLTVAENIAFAQHLGRVHGVRRSRIEADGACGDAAHRHRTRPRGEGGRAVDRAAPARCHLPRAGGRGAAGHHGRADLLADAPRGRLAARRHRRAEAARHRHRLRQPQAGRGAGDRREGDGAARRPQTRHLRGQRDDQSPPRRADDRRAVRLHDQCAGSVGCQGRAVGAQSVAAGRLRGYQLRRSRRRDRRHDRPARVPGAPSWPCRCSGCGRPIAGR